MPVDQAVRSSIETETFTAVGYPDTNALALIREVADNLEVAITKLGSRVNVTSASIILQKGEVGDDGDENLIEVLIAVGTLLYTTNIPASGNRG